MDYRRKETQYRLERASMQTGQLSFDGFHGLSRVFRFVFLLSSMLLCSCASQGAANRPLQLLSGSAPVYPQALISRGVGGQVTLGYDVTAQGTVVNIRVVASEPSGLFEAAAVQAVSSWVFRPQQRDGKFEAVEGLESTLEFRTP